MANTPSNGWQHHPQEEEEEEEEGEEEDEEDELQGGSAPNGGPNMRESRLVGHIDRWNISSSSQEILEDVQLLQELNDYQDLLEENGEDYDFEYLEGDEISEDLSPLSYWRPKTDQQLDFPEDNREQDSSEGQAKPGGAWDVASEGEAYAELSFEGQYGSEFSTSPEALRDPMALYKHRKSHSFTSDGGEEELSENSNLSPSPSGPPPEHSRLKIDVLEIQGLEMEEFPQETELSSLLERSHACSSPTGSMPWSRRPLGHPLMEHLQNSASIDAEMFPESFWMENVAQPVETVLKMATAQMGQRRPSTQREGLLDSREATETPPALRRLSYRQPERAQKLKIDIPYGLPSKFRRQSRSLSPQGRASQRKDGGAGSSQPNQASQPALVTGDPLPYGRGKLNYPLPDLSKVEPRVRFPKDSESYHPPRGKTIPARSKDPGKPVIFKSPAEIVREVLMSSGEGSPQKYAAPTVSVIPEELKSPRQATELVHQLQEDYHKLLTKYAEAENTIDRLRLGTKVRLYADPPKPSHGVQMGTVSQPSKVMTFSIPQVRAAEVTGRSSSVPEPAQNKGFSGQRIVSSSLPNSADTDIPKVDGFTSPGTGFTGDDLTQLLASQAKKIRDQVESLEELIWTGRLTPEDQQKGFARLKEAQGALEQAYLQARDEHRLLQKQQEPAGALGDFDPDRVVEGEIFHLEMRLEELKERLEEAVSNQLLAQKRPEETISSSSHFLVQSPKAQMGSPTPSLQAPTPAIQTPYPQASDLENSRYKVQADMEGSSISDEMIEEGEGLPEPLRHMQLQVEKDFDHLLGHYSSFKSLPEALSLEQLHSEAHHFSPEETDGTTATENPGTNEDSVQTVPKDKKATRVSSSSSTKEAQQRKPLHLLPRKPQRPPYQVRDVTSAQAVNLATQEESSEKDRTSGSLRKVSSREKEEKLSPHSSMVSVEDSSISERISQKPFRKTNMALSEDLRILSPETDSGFVGSEASRVSPLAQMPKHHSSQLRSHGMMGESVPTNGAHHPAPQKKGAIVMEPQGADVSPRNRPSESGLQRRSLSKRVPHRIRSPRQRTNNIASEMEPGTESSHNNSEAEAELPSRHGTYNLLPDEPKRSCSPSSSATSLSPSRMHSYSLLNSRMERDQAIAALQDEVSQLRQSLDETLHGPFGYPKHSSSPRASKLPMPPQNSASFFTSADPTRKTSGKRAVESEDMPSPIKSEERMRRSSLGRGGTQEDLTPTGSDYSTPKSQKGRQKEVSPSRMENPKQSTLRGPYTGTPYAFPNQASREPRIIKGTSLCSHCQGAKTHLGEALTSTPSTNEIEGSDSQKDSFGTSRHTTQKKTEAPTCLFCRDTGKRKTKVVHGQNHTREDIHTQDSGGQQKSHHHHPSQRPGLWYTAVPPQVPTIGYIPTIPLAPYPLSSIIYPPPLVTTSTSLSSAGLPVYNHRKFQPAELKTWASWRRLRANPHYSSALDSDDRMQDLNCSLDHAVEVAKDMKSTTRRMSRYLTWELNKVRSLRESCLF
ncbi:microtubule organization protein AKNA isoform X2 [Sceloporus undulatus]|uniref:microtubule organization protein AKNA isoform X2 n=1 Tax=Sceloporus undulatus TaxID=8520 RepID=UPI001C4AEBBC|nr:microtubule organization protein AKNA isoform X2 [Sceloporus undulatus]